MRFVAGDMLGIFGIWIVDARWRRLGRVRSGGTGRPSSILGRLGRAAITTLGIVAGMAAGMALGATVGIRPTSDTRITSSDIKHF